MRVIRGCAKDEGLRRRSALTTLPPNPQLEPSRKGIQQTPKRHMAALASVPQSTQGIGLGLFVALGALSGEIGISANR